MSPDDLFEEFLERFCASGEASIPPDWPEDLRRRCLFFARMLSGSDRSPASAERSVLASFEDAGVTARLSLAGESSPPPDARREGDRYMVEREIGRGGMGRVLLVYDRDFRRRVAMKVLLGAKAPAGRLSRFLEEAQATAQLEHPNIAPVYDLGVEAGGAPFFTMKWIRGRNLREILDSGEKRPSLVRLVQILQQAAMGVHFANSRGVIHRDLKPQNIMVGDYGEVLVVDWGLAKLLHAAEGERPGGEPLSTERMDEGALTIEGSVHGSPAYMAPEQAVGDVAAIDARTDVFGLGAVLYEVLTGTPPYRDASSRVVLGKARSGEVEPPSRRAPEKSIPRPLEELCLRALAARREDRFQSVGELHDGLQRYIEGIHDAERRAVEAGRLLDAAGALRGELRDAEERQKDLESRAAGLGSRLADHDREEAKQPLWDLAARLGEARDQAASAFSRTTSAYLAVLSIDPENPAARGALGEMYYQRLVAAEERGDREAAGLHEGLVRQYGGAQLRIELEGGGVLRLASDPPGAEVLLSRYEEKGPLLVAAPPELIGRTPIERPLARGSYLARLRLPGRSEVRYPFLLRRCATHEGTVRLYPEGEIAEGFIQIPGGETIVGGDVQALRTLPRACVFVAELFAARFPVTLGEYCAFLDEEFGAGQPGLREHLPFYGEEEYVVRGQDGRFAPLERLGPRVPVMAIPIPACEAYCRWLGRKLGKDLRLLEEIEWERCARGADGRIYPWGNGFDWAFCKGGPSRKGKPFPEPVGAFPRDESLFGVRDLAGGVRELCAGEYEETYRSLRGGSWIHPYSFLFRTDCRSTRGHFTRTTDAGFRVCYH